MGKSRIVAETGAGQHGVATATVCALLGMQCVVYMGVDDMARQALNVFRMRMLGAEVRGVDSGSRTLKDAINEAMRDWVATVQDTYYLLGSALGPHPYPLMVREFQSVIGEEARVQCLAQYGRLPDAAVACVGGGSNAMGLFDAFVADRGVRLIGVEAGGEGIEGGRHAARFAGGTPGVLQGTRTFVLQDAAGNIEPTHSVSAGLDYAAVGPEHADLLQQGRAEYRYATDPEALAAFQRLAQLEGILPALESAHAIAAVEQVAREVGHGRPGAGEPVGPRRQGRAEHPATARRSGMSTRLDGAFASMKAERRTGLVAFVSGGDPTLERSADVIRAVDEGGADVIEIGVPFSDPLADGPEIQRSSERALRAGATLRGVLDLVGGPPEGRRRTAGAVQLRQPRGALRRRGVRRPCGGGRRRRRAAARPAARGGGADARRARRARAGAHLPGEPDDRRGRVCARRTTSGRASCTRSRGSA